MFTYTSGANGPRSYLASFILRSYYAPGPDADVLLILYKRSVNNCYFSLLLRYRRSTLCNNVAVSYVDHFKVIRQKQ